MFRYSISCLSILAAFVITGCSNQSASKKIESAESPAMKTVEAMPGTIFQVYCENIPSITYQTYLPIGYVQDKKYPLIVLFDAHKKSRLPLKLYSKIADKLEYILICSDQSENGMNIETCRNIGNNMVTDATKRFAVDSDKIYSGGFSGGARVACDFALNNNLIKGVIMNSAGFDIQAVSKRKDLILVGLAGIEDFNLSEMFPCFDQVFQAKDHQKSLLLTFDGKHEWAPEISMELALNFFNPSASKEEADDDFVRLRKEMKDILTEEIRLRNLYIDQLMSISNLDWWRNEIKQIAQKKSNSSPSKSAMYSRLQGILSLYCYTNANTAIKSQQQQAAEHYASLYEIIDPTNAEWAYMQAVLASRKNNSDLVLEKLNKAVSLNFNDKNRLMSQPEFAMLNGKPAYTELVNIIKPDTSNN